MGGLKAYTGTRRIALILSNRKPAGIRQSTHRIASEKQPPNNWSVPNSHLIRVADVAGEAAPARNLDPHLLAHDPCLCKSDWEIHARIQQHIVIGIVTKSAAEHVGIKPKLPEAAVVKFDKEETIEFENRKVKARRFSLSKGDGKDRFYYVDATNRLVRVHMTSEDDKDVEMTLSDEKRAKDIDTKD